MKFSCYDRNKARVCSHQVSRTPSQRYSRSNDRSPYSLSAKLPNVPIFEEDKCRGNPYVSTSHGDEELEDLGPVYDSALTASQHASCLNLPGDTGGENLQDTEEYEVMLATRANPAYNNVQRQTTVTATTTAHTQVPLGGIYEQLP